MNAPLAFFASAGIQYKLDLDENYISSNKANISIHKIGLNCSIEGSLKSNDNSKLYNFSISGKYVSSKKYWIKYQESLTFMTK